MKKEAWVFSIIILAIVLTFFPQHTAPTVGHAPLNTPIINKIVEGSPLADTIYADVNGEIRISNQFLHDHRTGVFCDGPKFVEMVEIHGNEGDDNIDATGCKIVTIKGGPGNDILKGQNIYGGPGNDIIRGIKTDHRYSVSLHGDSGDDTIIGSNEKDIIRGGEGHDEIFGNEKRDRISGGPGRDLILGNGGNDRIIGGAGHDTIEGGAGDDFLCGDGFIDQEDMPGWEQCKPSTNEGDDHLFGDEDDDEMYGLGGNDELYGGPGNDYLEGNKGDDILCGEEDKDEILGNAGADTGNGGADDSNDDNDILWADRDDIAMEGDRGYKKDGNDNDVIHNGIACDDQFTIPNCNTHTDDIPNRGICAGSRPKEQPPNRPDY